MRKLMWTVLGFVTACALWAYASAGCVFLAAAALLGMLPGLLRWKSSRLRIVFVLMLGLLAGAVRCGIYEYTDLSFLSQLEDSASEGSVTLTDYSFETGYGRGAEGIIRLNGKEYQTIVYLDPGEVLSPGTTVSGTFRFRLTTPESAKGLTSHAGKGILFLTYQKGEVTFGMSEKESLLIKVSLFRRQIRQRLEEYLPREAAPFAMALLLGDTSELSYETDTALKVSGIRHVAAVSGLHVSILVALLTTLTLRKRWLTVLLGFPMLAAFAALAGFSPSVNRACIMSGLMLLSYMVRREYDGPTALSFSVLTMAAVNPLAVTSPALQLSAASVAGIFLFAQPLQRKLSDLWQVKQDRSLKTKFQRTVIATLSTCMSTLVLTIPLCAYYFDMVSVLSVVTNLLTLWLISIIFYGLMVVYLLSLWLPGAAVLLGKGIGLLIGWVLQVARIIASIPFACVYTASVYTVIWLVFVYVLLFAYFLNTKQSLKLTFLAVAGSFLLTVACSWAEPMLHETVITVIDVGQGQSILLQSQGKVYLVDCGGDGDAMAADAAAAQLLSRGITRLDGLIITHTDQDHMGGCANLLSRVKADVIILSVQPHDLDTKDAQVIYADREMTLQWGSAKLTVFGENLPGTANENSLCILLDTEKCDILITGDRNGEGEARLLEQGELSHVDVLVAGHHGGATSTSQALLDAVNPDMVCISVGADNRYGHPADQVLQRLENQGCRILRTDLHGTITIRR
ncbi:MAG: DNA internalization-related competence protein ComEC/Rec2 [Oscillospiraceae bacterium]|nr:DNA internalization-related competence protein ComEC/Rec2 [Oscillospiraceae bacterium]